MNRFILLGAVIASCVAYAADVVPTDIQQPGTQPGQVGKTAKLERAVGRIGSRCSSDGNELSIYFSEPGDSGYIAGSCRVSGTSTHFDRLSVPNHIAEQILAWLAAASSET